MTELFQTPKPNDQFTDLSGNKFTVKKLFNVNDDSWIEYENERHQPFYCRTEAFLTRFHPMTN